MEYLWVASVTAMLAGKWIWAIVMYLFLFYGCYKLPFPGFSGIKPWIIAALGVRVAVLFAPETHWIQWIFTVLQSVFYFWIWYQCFRGIRQMESVYGNLNGRGIFSAYWVELVLAIAGVYVLGIPVVPWFDRTIQPAMILLQAWKGHLLYYSYRNYEIRRRQLAKLSDEV